MNDETTLRPLIGTDAPAHRRMMAQAFDRGRVQKDSERTEEEEAGAVKRCVGIFDANNQLQAVQQTHLFLIHWPGSIGKGLLMGGVAGVATRPEARGRKYVERLLRDTLQRMKDEGQVVSALYPFSWTFYHRSGWDWVGEKRNITVPLREIPSFPEGKFVRQVPSEDAEKVIEPIYTQYAAKYRGMFKTESHQWKGSLGHSDDRTTYVYAYFPNGGEEPTAYLLWRYSSSNDQGQVREFVANTPDGFRALISLLHYFGTQCQAARLTLPADNPLWSFVMHWELKTEIQPVFMGRVVDVCAALSQLDTPRDLPDASTVTLAIQDDAAPWNNGTFAVEIKDGLVNCTPATSTTDTADIALDIQALSQAFWGSPSLSALRTAGRITVNNDTAFAVLEKLLPAMPVYTFDGF